MENGDLRVLSVATHWLEVHSARLNADRLIRPVMNSESNRVRAYWSAVAFWLRKDRRFARLTHQIFKSKVELLPIGTAFQIQRLGEDERFSGSVLLVPKGTLRARASDVVSAEVLTQHHPGYRNRVRMGPNFRADLWTLLEHNQELTVSKLARTASCSFAAAWETTQAFRLFQRAQTTNNNSPAKTNL